MKNNYSIDLNGLTLSEAFEEANEDELRVLLAIIEREGDTDVDEIKALTGVSLGRVKAAITLWRESGVIHENTGSEGDVSLEFEEDELSGDIVEEESVQVARSLRDSELADVISECARLMGRPSLNTQEVKHITAMWSQLALSPEYILTLAAHMAEGGRLTPLRLLRDANRLTEKGIDTLESLERYINNLSDITPAICEIRNMLGLWTRNLSKTEKAHFTRWTEEFGFSTAIIGEAFELATESGTKRIPSYMNKILTRWHEAGCKTVEDCRRKSAEFYAERASKKAMAAAKPQKGDTGKPKTPKYADFDPEEAMARALARSYGAPEDNGEGAE